MASDNRKLAYDFAKGIAMLFVLLGHTYGRVDEANGVVMNIIGSIHNPLFYFVSGMLLVITISRTNSMLKLIKKKFYNLFLVFLIWLSIDTMAMTIFLDNMK